MIRVANMKEWMSKYTSNRLFAYESSHTKMNEFFMILDRIAFYNMDERLTPLLVEKIGLIEHNIIKNMYQKID